MPERADLNEDFRDILACLAAAHVEFVIVGAHALAAHGLPRATGDIDVLVRPSQENAQRVMQALGAFGAPRTASVPPTSRSLARSTKWASRRAASTC